MEETLREKERERERERKNYSNTSNISLKKSGVEFL